MTLSCMSEVRKSSILSFSLKCTVLALKKGLKIKSEGGKILGNNEIRSLQETDGYKYLRVLQNDEIMKGK